jgi:hypothetical protein
MKQLNINAHVEVKLTEYGKEIFKKHYSDFPENIKPKIPNILKTELWKIMNIFGDCLYHGNLKIPFENNLIVVNDSEFNQEIKINKKENKTCLTCFEYQAGCLYPKADKSGCDKWIDYF